MAIVNHCSTLERLISEGAERPWLEFKHNNAEPQEIGEYISALANTAALEGKAHAYLLWGVDDATHQAIGTTFDPAHKRVGNEELENWLEGQVRLHGIEELSRLLADAQRRLAG